jgi:hypothetical protein
MLVPRQVSNSSINPRTADQYADQAEAPIVLTLLDVDRQHS